MTTTAASRYAKLEAEDRRPFLDRARTCAKLTIPTLFPPEGSNNSTRYDTPYQGVGARGVNNLASKLLLTLFPPHSPHFKFEVDELTLEELTGSEGMEAEVSKALSAYTKRVMTDVEVRAFRPTVFEALKHLIVGGNGTLYVPEEGPSRFYQLEKFVCKRDPSGKLLELILKENIAIAAVPPELQSAVREQNTTDEKTTDDTVDLYTHVYLEDGLYQVYQELDGAPVPGSEGSYPPDRMPWLVLRFNKVDGENYGRGHCEEYLGDLNALEELSKAVVEYTAIASRVFMFVKPNGTTSARILKQASNGDILAGTADDVTVLTLEKYNDFRAARETMQEVEQRLAFAFLLNTAIQRPGERVTAEEIRYMARELESTLGGVYSVLSQELQLPVTKILIFQLVKTGKLDELPETVQPKIVTGLDALGRGNDLAQLDAFIQGAMALAPEAASSVINWQDYMTRRGASLGIDMDGLIKTEEQIAQEQQQAQMMQMAAKLGPNAINQVGQMAQNAQQETPQDG
jgi:hypothetical protein